MPSGSTVGTGGDADDAGGWVHAGDAASISSDRVSQHDSRWLAGFEFM